MDADFGIVMETLKRMETRLMSVERQLSAINAKGPDHGPKGIAPGAVASDGDLDSKWGDPVVHKDPPRWTGTASYAGRKFSVCPPEYLDEVASFLDWKAAKNDGDPVRDKYAAYDRKDAMRARGWAARHRAGKTRPVVPAEPDWDGDDAGEAEADAMAGQWDDR